jgi:hypothetical protein
LKNGSKPAPIAVVFESCCRIPAIFEVDGDTILNLIIIQIELSLKCWGRNHEMTKRKAMRVQPRDAQVMGVDNRLMGTAKRSVLLHISNGSVESNMRLRGNPSIPDENLASSRARRSTAFAGSFTEPVRSENQNRRLHAISLTFSADSHISSRPTGISIAPSRTSSLAQENARAQC